LNYCTRNFCSIPVWK